MANTTKSTKTTTKKVEVADAAPVIVDDEKEQLKAQLAEQQRKMDELMAQIGVLMKAQANETSVVDDKAKYMRNIKFINMCPGNINLMGTRMHRIEGQYKYKMIPESEAYSVVNNMPETVSSGMVYIDDAEFVHKCDLDEVYRHILSVKDLKELFSHDVFDICEVYKTATDQQKQIIVDTISNMVLDGKAVDANVLVKIGELSGKNLIDIEPLKEE